MRCVNHKLGWVSPAAGRADWRQGRKSCLKGASRKHGGKNHLPAASSVAFFKAAAMLCREFSMTSPETQKVNLK